MDISVALKPEAVTLLSDCDSSLASTGAKFLAQLNAGNSRDLDDVDFAQIFQDSLQLKAILDKVGNFVAHGHIQPSYSLLATILNCEYQINCLNAATPIRYNPFLSHWVETLLAWREHSETHKGHEENRDTEIVSWQTIQEKRVALIRCILLSGEQLENIVQQTPTQLLATLPALPPPEFDLEYFVKILEDEEIYERSQSPEQQTASAPRPLESSGHTRPGHDLKEDDAVVDSSDNILERISADPESAGKILTHLPIDLPSLDILTTLLQDGVLESLSLEPVATVRDYIQHSLRSIERMGRRPATIPDIGSSAAAEQEFGESGEYGQQAQTRAVRLLMLFMRNLVRKALVPPEELYYEIQEICVRYIWIREVREFRAFMEGMG